MRPHIEVVTTFNADGFEAYGKRFIETFIKHWHGDISLSVYNEGGSGDFTYGQRVRFYSYETHCPEGVKFKAQDMPEPPPVEVNRYRFDAKRFSHKSFALAAAARRTKADYLILMDADVETFGYVSPEWLEWDCFYADTSEGDVKPHVACLQRPFFHHTESAFVMHRMCPKVRDLIQSIEDCYTTGHIFTLDGWCDSSVADYVRGRFESERGLLIHNLTNGVPEDGLTVFEKSILGQKMTHKKGRRKLVDNPVQRTGNGGRELGAPHGPHVAHS